jgi:hypothetical protein
MSKITTIPEAARLARATASDIAIYNVEKIKRGIENDQLFEELADDLREADRMWANKVSEDIVNGTNLLQKAIIDIIFAGSGVTASRIF